MRPKSIVLLGLALACGLVASIGISQVMEARKQEPAPTGEMQVIAVALTDIKDNDKITPQVIKFEEWPKSKIPAGALTKLEDIEGKRCRTTIYAGEPILAAKLVGADESERAGDHIPKGYRVCAVQVDAVASTGSLLRPGDRVDVLVYMNRNAGGRDETSTRTILQDIGVFAVDTAFVGKDHKDDQAPTAKTVSLLVTPSQAEKVTLASEMGHIRLVLRGDEDSQQNSSNGATVAELLGGSDASNREAEQAKPPAGDKSLLDLLNAQKTAEPTAPPAEAWKMVLMRGGDLDEIQFPASGDLPRELLVKDKPSDPSQAMHLPTGTVPEPPDAQAGESDDEPNTDDPNASDPSDGGAANDY